MAIINYRCGNCGDDHDTYGQAMACCQPGIGEVYFCEACDREHNSEDEADACCDSEATA